MLHFNGNLQLCYLYYNYCTRFYNHNLLNFTLSVIQ